MQAISGLPFANKTFLLVNPFEPDLAVIIAIFFIILTALILDLRNDYLELIDLLQNPFPHLYLKYHTNASD